MSQVVEYVERVIVPEPPTDLPYEDGEPMESNWQRIQISLLVESTHQRWPNRTDFFAGGNMFLYYSARQARDRDYRGPDFFVVKDVDGTRSRRSWIVWEEDGQMPDMVVELLSPTTADDDLGPKKDLYEQRLKITEYFCFGEDGKLLGWRLRDLRYVPLQPNEHGRLWSAELQTWLGPWPGKFQGTTTTWLRFFFSDGSLVSLPEEAAEAERQRAEAERQQAEAERQRAEAERQRADAQRQRAEAAEAELARLRAELAKLKG